MPARSRSPHGLCLIPALLLPLSACAELEPLPIESDSTSTLASDAGTAFEEDPLAEVSSQSSALNGNIRYAGDGSPFMVAHWERTAKHDRILVRAPAFTQCIQNSMAAPRAADGSQGRPGAPRYLACQPSEPNRDESISVQTSRLLSALRTFNNDLITTLAPRGRTEAGYQGYGTYEPHTVFAGGGFHESFSRPDLYDWDDYTGIEPWNFHAGSVMHEFLHTHNYGHLDAECTASQCDPVAFPECQWTTACGGPGTPPTSTNWDNVGRAARNFCAWQRLDDDTAYLAAGEPSIPYIVSGCSGSIFTQSEAQCAGGIFDNPLCGRGQLRLLVSWTGTSADAQTSTSCTCYADPRHTIALQTSTGHYLTAWEGGGDSIRTRVSERLGSWQTFFAIEQSTSPWRSNDTIQLKAFNGDWVDTDFFADRTYPGTLSLGLSNPLPWSVVGNGSQVILRSAANHARDNGQRLESASGAVSGNGVFSLVEFDRSTIVYLQGDHGFYVNADSEGFLWNRYADSTLRNLHTVYDLFRMRSGFRIIDWNGGSLESGDVVSMEALLGDQWHFVSTPSTSGQARLDHSVAAHGRFVIRKVSGSSGNVIDHNDFVSFRSVSGNYLSAIPTDGRPLSNAGTWEGPWQRFRLRMVQHFDMTRPTW
ncbi:MAG: hypothetical protein R3B99_04440 [Polyangiales bacterium]